MQGRGSSSVMRFTCDTGGVVDAHVLADTPGCVQAVSGQNLLAFNHTEVTACQIFGNSPNPEVLRDRIWGYRTRKSALHVAKRSQSIREITQQCNFEHTP